MILVIAIGLGCLAIAGLLGLFAFSDMIGHRPPWLDRLERVWWGAFLVAGVGSCAVSGISWILACIGQPWLIEQMDQAYRRLGAEGQAVPLLDLWGLMFTAFSLWFGSAAVAIPSFVRWKISCAQKRKLEERRRQAFLAQFSRPQVHWPPGHPAR